MEWLKDPKNQPIVIAVLVVVILGAVGLVFFMNRQGSGGGSASVDSSTATAPTTPSVSPGTPSGMPVGPVGTPPSPGISPASGTSPAGPIGQSTPRISVAKIEESRPDPFLPFDWKAPPPPGSEPVRIPMPGRIFQPKVWPDIENDKPETPQPPRRMAGILFKDRVYAILETSGPAGSTTMVVKPGDITDDGMRVERIEPNRIILSTTIGPPRTVDVKMAPSQRQPEQPTGGVMGVPGSPYMPYGAPGSRSPMPYGGRFREGPVDRIEM